jgi:Membrane bound FAD containing D-sorbitol dehydrogenase
MPDALSSPVRDSTLEDFLALSRILTGVENLDAELGRLYLDRLTSTPFGPSLRQILDRFRGLGADATLAGRVKREILADDGLRPTVGQIILLWYTSAMWDSLTSVPIALRYGTQEEYFSGLAWQIMGAHVPGLSGGYFGHWRYRPENEPKGGV